MIPIIGALFAKLSVLNATIITATLLGLVIGKRFINGPHVSKVVDLHGKLAIVTGGNSGIGYETVKALSSMGAFVIIACRNLKKGEEAKAKVLSKIPNAQLDVMTIDLADMDSVQEFVTKFNEKYDILDILVNNAGIMFCPKGLTPQGYELQFGTNHLGHFLLTLLLLPNLLKSVSSRIITVASSFHRYAKGIDFDNLDTTKGYSATEAYARAKLANVMFTIALYDKLKDTNVKVFSCHPGTVRTELFRHVLDNPFAKLIQIMAFPFVWYATKDAESGAQTQIYLAIEDIDKLSNGQYYSNCKITATNKLATNPVLQEELWQTSYKACKDYVKDYVNNQ